ncbi:endonuclease/exonuclease/phosphatase family protein [Microbacterium sp. LRZ72]|uniref:endonuclease/exonuclease/phosphatase family protein n=1 Tax=Microbacterium sp. LRZ72 TaxID=2942481 RepID=UPI0029BF3D64|nr:endonuclease/exonuclease/phosphatase family protein [Microbacterium sp. LRZ72]MDX2375746.1 endonuclease/exonuclease/phosphatase family protein [Microbacterium sp. LRZ72]
MMRTVGILLTVLFAIAAAVLTWPSFFRVAQVFPLTQVVAFRTPLALAFGIVGLVLLLFAFARPLRAVALSMALIAIVAAAANGALILSRGLGTSELPAETDSSVRVMTWNTAGEPTDAAAIAQTAVAMGAEIVALPETAIETGEQVAVSMRELGSPMWVHHVEFGTDEGDARTTTLLITPDLGDYAVIESSQDGSSNTGVLPSAVAMPVDGDGPIVVAVHAVAPREDYMQRWRDDLSWLADQCADENVIMAGDFNATLDHMSHLGVDGGILGRCSDAAANSGNGSVGTWPTAVPALLGAPIDHVMYSTGWEVTGSIVLRSLDGSGSSDHRPLVAQFEPVE